MLSCNLIVLSVVIYMCLGFQTKVVPNQVVKLVRAGRGGGAGVRGRQGNHQS